MATPASGRNQGAQGRWLRVKNNSGVTAVPAFGLVRVVSVDGSGLFTVDQPNADSMDVMVAGNLGIPAGGYGLATRDFPCFAAYNTGGTPAAGATTWGAASGSYLLTSGKSGFTTLGAGVGSGALSRVLVQPTNTSGGSSGGGSLALLDNTGTTVDAACTSLKMDAGGVCTTTHLSAGHDQLGFTYATATQDGIVSQNPQTFGGDKTFNNQVTVNSDLHALLHAFVTHTIYALGVGGNHFATSSISTPTQIQTTLSSSSDGAGSFIQSYVLWDAATGTSQQGGMDLGVVGLKLRVGSYFCQGSAGQTGTDPVGNVFTGGILTTKGTGAVGPPSGTADQILAYPGGVATAVDEIEPKHISIRGPAPTVAALPGAGAAPTVSFSGHDGAGELTVTTGTGSGVGGLCTVTYNSTFTEADGSKTAVVLTPSNANASGLSFFVDDTATDNTKFTLATNSAPADSTAYTWYVHVMGY